MILLGLMFILSACAHSSATHGSTTTKSGAPMATATHGTTYAPVHDACALASVSEIGGIVGLTVQAQSTIVQSLATCTYTVSTQDFVQTNINIEPSIDEAQNDFNDQQAGVTITNVTGIGDAAFFDGNETLTVLRKNAITTVILHVASVQQKLSSDKQIAHLILPRLS